MPEPHNPPHLFRVGPGIVLIILAMVVVPAGITLYGVRGASNSADPTPYGYTWSLLLFVAPIAVIATWLFPQERMHLPKHAFWKTITILVLLGCALDFFFAQHFFRFPNPKATLGLRAPALGGTVPIEEYLFYLTGFIAILLIYIWLDEFWLAAYSAPDYVAKAKANDRLLMFHPVSAALGVALIAMAIIYKKLVLAAPGFPAYFTVLVAGGLIPAAGFYSTVRRFINWRAFSLTLLYILLVSLVWEATLALPYGWWGYQGKQMLGISVKAWSDLPIEAVCVWLAVTYGTVITFEVVKIWHASEKTARQAFLGSKKTSSKVGVAAGS